MKRIITIAFLSFLCFVHGYGGNHSMHPLKQVNYVLKQIKAQHEPYYSAYQQLMPTRYWLSPTMHLSILPYRDFMLTLKNTVPTL
mgnify:CR=1 FL=1